MENESNNQYNNNSKDKNKYIPIHKQYLDDSETNDSSTRYRTDISEKNNSLIEDLNRGFQKSIGFFPKKIYLEEPETEDNIANKRKYSMEEHLIIKDFVPHLKPIEMHFVPSKLNLNENGFRNLKYNKDDILLNNKYCSCPNSEEESDAYLSPSKTSDVINNTKKMRKKLKNLKNNNIPKVMTKNIIESNCKLFKDDYEYDLEKESLDLDDNLLLYDDDDFINSNFTSLDIDNENKKINKEENEDKKNRINSCSILDALKNRLSFDGTI